MRILGYNYWSLTDNYEWGSYKPRFGLYTVNVQTDVNLTRDPTHAVAAYAGLIANHGVPLDYKPKVAPQACSLVAPAASCLRPVRVR
ncbi:family 1 glycosylhydrolase [Aquabacterium sp.]|uniref:family 1 glycosylhydrolase n=1 Tax=Aquabacterium sp. TaxID=1872578 RepID=UPI0025BCAC63|nr:family 1 glycosylhydrolase [Aquabacterium sp.]